MRKLIHQEIQLQRKSQEQMEALKRFPIVCLIDNVRSLYNVGSIFRTSDGACIEKIYLTGFTPTPPRKEIEKTSLGATKTIPWEYFEDPLVPIKMLKQNGYKIILVEMTTSGFNYSNLKVDNFPVCFIFGNELVGVSNKLFEIADFSIEIPMHGSKHSLNVAVAYGIVLFDAIRVLTNK
ncbi:MAG: TrmH family RNA methyltransferase [Bacteroidetes bacterium]|nr:TrmH family RNA methyltransferase [Bacteroidota bacterium]